MAIRFWVFVALVLATIGLIWHCDKSCSSNGSWIGTFPMIATLLVIISWTMSGYLVIQTRKHDVVGVSRPPYFGLRAMQHRVVLVTGANSGVGKETARQLAAMGATVVLLCRNATKAQDAMNDIVEEQKHQSARIKIRKEQLIFVPLDLSDFASIHKAVDAIRILLEGYRVTASQADSKESKVVDILVNNAGLMMGHKTLSKHDRLEMMMQANHLGHFLLTRLLIDQGLMNMERGRILNLTSSTYQFSTSGFDFEDMFCNGKRKYTLFGQYSMTKLANILFSKELERRYNGKLLVYAIHPGIVRTNVTSNMQWFWRLPNDIFAVFVMAIQKTSAEGAYSSVFCAAAPVPEAVASTNDSLQLPPSGSYILNCRAYPTATTLICTKDAKKLWEVSEKLVSLSVTDSESSCSKPLEEKKID